MRFILETITGRKGIKNFSSLEEYVDFMTKNGDKIKNIVESDLPYDDKPVSVATPSQSNGWEQVNKATFGDVIKKAEKGDCVLPHKASSVFKDEAKFEPSKTSEKADTSSEPKVDSTPVKNNNEGEEKDLPKFEYKDEEKSSSETSEKSEPKEEKKDSEEKDEKKKEQVDESLGDKIHDLGVKAKQKLGIGLSGKELEDYINEYFVYVFMIANHQVKPNHPGFEKIAEKLIKTDSKMENVHDVVMSILEDKYYMNGFPADTIEDLLKRRLAGLGIDESIIDKAYNTFVEEEKNKDDGSFDDDITEALKIAGVQLNETKTSNGKLKRLIYKLNGLLKFMKTIDVSDNEILDDQINGLWNNICYTIEEIKETLKSRKLNEAEDDILELDEYEDGEGINQQVLQELYEIICENYGEDWLSDNDEVDFMEIENAVSDFGNDIDGYNESLRHDYALALQDKWSEEHMNEDINNPEDGEIDEKTGKEKLMEEPSSGDDGSVDYAKHQVELWKDAMYANEIGDDMYYSNGHRRRDEANLNYWEQEVKKRSKGPEEDPFAALYAANAKFMKNNGNSFAHNVGEKLVNNENGQVYKITSVSKDTNSGKSEYVLRNEDTYEDEYVNDDELNSKFKAQ